MTEQHPMQPPPELFGEWLAEACRQITNGRPGDIAGIVARLAYAAGADAQLEADCEWLEQGPYGASITVNHVTEKLRAAMRPKPPSLSEQATRELDDAVMRGDCITTTEAMPALRAALKRLSELEALPMTDITVPRLTCEQAVIMSAFTGIACCKFSHLHKEVEQRLNRPVFTHEFASPDFADQVKELFRDDFLSICFTEALPDD